MALRGGAPPGRARRRRRGSRGGVQAAMTFLLTVTVISLLLATIMSVIAWRMTGDERRRSDARVAALAAEIHDVEPSPLFAPSRGASAARPIAALLTGAFVVGAIGAIALFLPRTRAHVPLVTGPAAAAQSPAPALELVALGHERVGDQLTVRG